MGEKRAELKNIGSLWLKDGAKGKYMSGEMELFGTKLHVFVFKNDKDGVEKRPDYRVFTEGEAAVEKEKFNDIDQDPPF